MKIDSIYILYENSGKYFNTYTEAYYNGKNKGYEKNVYYVFTPTMHRFSNTRELYDHSVVFFRNKYDADYLDLISRTLHKQLKLF